MAPLALPSCSPRCGAFSSTRRARAATSLRMLSSPARRRVAAASDQVHSASAGVEECSTSARVAQGTLAALLAGGVFAGACLAADTPESAAQAVATAKLASDILRPLFSVFTLLYIVRVPMTWYPDIDGTKMPWAIAYVPTEAVLSATRKVVPLVSGVDVSPIVWVGIISFLNEILLGPQGLLTLVQARGGL